VSAGEASDELITLNDTYRELLVADETGPFLSSCVLVSEGVQLREQLSGERLAARINQRLIELDLDEVGVPHPEEDREQSTEEEADYYVEEADDKDCNQNQSGERLWETSVRDCRVPD
jgi:hypothetical protein